MLLAVVLVTMLMWAFALWLMNEPSDSTHASEKSHEFEISVFMLGLWVPWLLVLGLVVYASAHRPAQDHDGSTR